MKNIWMKFKEIFFKITAVIAASIMRTLIGIIAEMREERDYKKRKIRNKIRLFKPTFVEKNGKTETHWEMRDKPLTDAQLDELDKY
jgi:pilus assembly protein TadC